MSSNIPSEFTVIYQEQVRRQSALEDPNLVIAKVRNYVQLVAAKALQLLLLSAWLIISSKVRTWGPFLNLTVELKRTS